MAYLKRGQVTPFIIIGILLLIGAVMLFTAREQKTFAPQEAPAAVQEVPFEIEPLNRFVAKCLEQTSGEALVLLGQHGGYIDPASPDYGMPIFQSDAARPTESDALTFIDGWHVPYWHHMDKPNNGKSGVHFTSNTPTEKNVEEQISAFVEKHLTSCLGEFSSFAEQGFVVTPTRPPKAAATVAPRSVIITLTFPLKITKGTAAYELKTFRATHELALRSLLQFAEQLTATLVQGQALEQVVIQTIAAYAGLENQLPPISAFQSSGQKHTWSEQAVKQTLEAALSYSIEKVPVQGTANYVAPEQNPAVASDTLMLGLLRFLSGLRVADTDPSPYAVRFMYLPTWPSYFDVVKGDRIGPLMEAAPPGGGVITATLGSVLPTRLYNYETPYDVSIPVLVELVDTKTAFKNPLSPSSKGYSFYVALEANVRDNNPLSAQYRPRGLTQGYQSFSPFCNEDQRHSGKITLHVTDAVTRRPVPNAEVSFSSGSDCSLGQTSTDGSFAAKFPVAAGELKIDAKGYLPRRQFFTTKAGREKQASPALQPLVEKKIRVKKFPYNKIAAPVSTVRSVETNPKALWRRSVTPENLLPSETATLTFEKISADAFDAEYTTTATVKGTDTASVMLAPGKYKVSISTLLFEPILIPRCPSCVCAEYEEGVIAAVGSAITGDRPDCERYEDIKGADMRAGPFIEGSIEVVSTISPQHFAAPNDLTFFTLALNMRDVPEARSSAGGSVRERMVTDLQMLDVIADDAQHDIAVSARLASPVLT